MQAETREMQPLAESCGPDGSVRCEALKKRRGLRE